jgi:hypothetical protein
VLSHHLRQQYASSSNHPTVVCGGGEGGCDNNTRPPPIIPRVKTADVSKTRCRTCDSANGFHHRLCWQH